MKRHRGAGSSRRLLALGLVLGLSLFGLVLYAVWPGRDEPEAVAPVATVPLTDEEAEAVAPPLTMRDPAPSAAPAPASKTEPPQLGVRVLDRDGRAEAEAEVVVTHVRGVSSDAEGPSSVRMERRTDGRGEAQFAAVPPGLLSVQARKDGRAAFSMVMLPTLETYERCTLILAPAAGIAGRVVEAGGRPVAGARVATYTKDYIDTPRIEAATGDDGGFLLPDLPPGFYQLGAEAEGWPAALSDIVQPGAQGVVIEMKAGGRIAGQVRSVTDGRPERDFHVEARVVGGRRKAASSRTDTAGRFVLDGLAEGTYVVYGRDENRVLVGPAPQAEVMPGRETAGVDLLVEPGTVVHGRVYEEDSQAPIPGVRVEVMSREGHHFVTDETDPEGRYRLAAIPAGPTTVTFLRAGDPLAPSTPVEIPAGAREFPLDYAWPQGVKVRGTVVDAGGAPAPGARVLVWTPAPTVNPDYWTDSATTDAEGRFSLLHCRAASTAWIQATGEGGKSPASAPFSIPETGLEGLTLRLEDVPTASASGYVVDTFGRPAWARLRMHLLSARDAGEQVRRSLFTEADGYFHVDGLVAGDYGVQVGHAGKPGTSMGTPQDGGTVTVRPGQSLTNLRFVLDSQGVISGTVYDEEGVAVKGAVVGAYAEDGQTPGPQARTDSSGRFELRGTPPGAYTVIVSMEGYADARQTGVHPEETVDLVLRRADQAGE